MKFGLHYLLSCPPGQSARSLYAETLEQTSLADELGFESVWPVEHHFNADFSVLPCPTLLLAAIAVRTQRLRLGTAVVQLPLHHPLRVAEEIAMLDVLSGGRVELGLGRGSNPLHYAGYGVPLAESSARLVEGLTLLQQALEGRAFSFHGQHYRVDDVAIVPAPTGPVRCHLAANSPETAVLAGRLGLPILVAAHVNPRPRLVELLACYAAARAEAGHPKAGPSDLSVLMPMYVGATQQEVENTMRPSVERYAKLLTDAARPLLARCKSDLERHKLEAQLAQMGRTTFDDVSGTMGVFGTPSACVEQLQSFRDELGMGRVIAWFNFGGLVAHERIAQSMRLFAQQVLPRLS